MKSRLAWGLWAFTLLGVTLLLLVATSGRATVTEGGTGLVVITTFLIFVLAFATTGALVASRRPSNPVGWIAAAVALIYVLAGLADSLVNSFPVQVRESGIVARSLVSIGESLWSVSLGLGGTLLLLLFPDGHLPSARWRPVAWAAGGALVTIPVAASLIPGRIQDYPVENPLGIPGAKTLLEAIVGAGLVVLVISILMSIASLFFRYRSASSTQRQQLKWLVFAVGFVAALVLVSIFIEATARDSDTAGEISNILSTVALSSIPFAIGVAILKHRLYDIDLIINRALVYGGLTAVLGLAYVTIVFGLQQVLSPVTRESDLAVAASTLVVAALFRPLRGRVQAFIDRRFYRRKFNAQKTLDGFSVRARNEVELAALSDQLVSVVKETMEPTYVSLWLRDPHTR